MKASATEQHLFPVLENRRTSEQALTEALLSVWTGTEGEKVAKDGLREG